MEPHYEIYKDGSDEWRWRIKAGNSEIVASGEGYKNKGDMLKAIELVMNATDVVERVDFRMALLEAEQES